MVHPLPFASVALLVLALLFPGVEESDSLGKVDFVRDVRPILAKRCFACHGPDAETREGDLRLDQPDDVFGDRGGYAAVVPSELQASEVWLRVSDDSDRMPPEKSDEALSAEELDVLRRWIEEGANWETHWAFRPAKRQPLPDTGGADWARNPIDRFVLARLEAEGLDPAPVANRATLLRRVSLDLTGLPPTPAELDAFLGDREHGAYERQVERLLASPRFGERMALPWLDAARYADTNGYHRDATRTMWLWRNGLIDALNRNQPYDEFVIEQLAGDLLPNATIEQRIASGFNRNHMLNDEGGAIPAEYQVEYVVDRVRTTSTVFLGLTMQCSQCHDHKYDPISQEEYYRFFAFFNRLPEKGLDGSNGPAEPKLVVPGEEDEAEITKLEEEIARERARMAEPMPEVDAREGAWVRDVREGLGAKWRALAAESASATEGAILTPQPDLSVLASGPNPDVATYELEYRTDAVPITALWLELLRDDSFAKGSVSRTSHGNFVLSELEVEAVSVADPSRTQAVALAGAVADYSQRKYAIQRAIDGDRNTGWAADAHVLIENRNAIFLPEAPFGFEGGTILRVRLHQEFGSQHTLGRFRLSVSSDSAFKEQANAAALSGWSSLGPLPGAPDELFLRDAGSDGRFDVEARVGDLGWVARPELEDGVVHTFEGQRSAVYYARTLDAPTARTLSVGFGSDDSIVVWLNGQRVLSNNAKRAPALDQELLDLALVQGSNELVVKVVNYGGPGGFAFRVLGEGPVVLPGDVTRAARSESPSDADRAVLRDHFRRVNVPQWSEWTGRIADLEGEIAAVRAALPALMVMRDEPGVRMTRILERGRYDLPGREVTAGVPAFLPPITARTGGEPDRLDLARWMTRPEHPLTARVAVNRIWLTIFGKGLVESQENFGTQAAFPSHPELLEHLAASFVESGWDVKGLVREIVTSATYRQTSDAPPSAFVRDPENRLLARGSSFRLPAEFVRDAALLVAGLLHEEVGGPSVRPYQPAGLWKEVSFNNDQRADSDFYTPDSGPGLYRRSLYTFWKRALPPPNLQTFDAPSREVCVVQRARTNTPLQALVLLNDPTFVEAARALAELVLTRDGLDQEARLALAFRRATSRQPDRKELALLRDLLEEGRERYSARADGAAALLGVGDSARDATLEANEHAAWTVVCSLILNLDETLTRR